MGAKVKIGLIGAGEIGAVHAEAWTQLEDVVFCVAGGRNPDRGRALATETGAIFYESVDAMLADGSVQGVDICVPNPLHREFAERVFAVGKHVMCEKPIALTLEDADSMMVAADRAGKILFIAHVLRFWPEYALAKQWVDAEVGGEVVLVTARRLVSVLEATTGTEGWRHDPAKSGGAVIDLQVHDVDFFNWLLGNPMRVSSQGVRSTEGAISHVWTTVDYENGAKGFFEGSFMFKGNPISIDFRLLSQEKSVEFIYAPVEFKLHGMKGQEAGESASSLVEYTWGQEGIPLYEPAEDSFALAMRDQVAHFAHCIREGADALLVKPEEARQALEICLAAQASCEEGRPVDL